MDVILKLRDEDAIQFTMYESRRNERGVEKSIDI